MILSSLVYYHFSKVVVSFLALNREQRIFRSTKWKNWHVKLMNFSVSVIWVVHPFLMFALESRLVAIIVTNKFNFVMLLGEKYWRGPVLLLSPRHHPTTTHNSKQVYTSHTPTYNTLFIKEGYEVNTYYKAKICLLYQTRWRTYLKEVWRSQEFFWFMPQLPPVFSKPSRIFRSLRVFTKTSWRNM